MIACRTECGTKFSKMDTLILKQSRPIPAMIMAMWCCIGEKPLAHTGHIGSGDVTTLLFRLCRCHWILKHMIPPAVGTSVGCACTRLEIEMPALERSETPVFWVETRTAGWANCLWGIMERLRGRQASLMKKTYLTDTKHSFFLDLKLYPEE